MSIIKDNTVIETPVGSIEYSYFDKPFVNKANPKDKPVYKTTLILTKEDAVAFNKQFAEEMQAKAADYIKGRTKVTQDGDSIEMTMADVQIKFPCKMEIDSETKSPTGRWFLSVTRSYEYVDKKGNLIQSSPIKVYGTAISEDGKQEQLDAATVGNGSKAKLKVLKRPVFVKDGVFSQPLWLEKAMVTDLVQYEPRNDNRF